MAIGKIALQANDTRTYEITAEDGAVGNVALTFPDATETVKGKVERATHIEVQAGTDTVRAVTPAGLLSAFANSKATKGDKYYKAKTTPSWWTTYNWCVNRNPIHNLALKMSVNEVITHYTWIGNRYTEDRIGREGYVYSEAIGISGKVYPMFRWCKLFTSTHGIELNIGYKNFNIQELNKHYKYSFTVSINPFKKFEE